MASPSPLLDCGIDLETVKIVAKCLYFILFIPALLLNVMAAWISWKLKTKSSFIVYLKNLVAADLLMTFIIPLRVADRLPGSSLALRAFNCQFGSVLFYLCLYVSIVLMGVISLDRFFKIVQPGGKLLGQSAVFGRVVSAVVWVVLLSITTIPTMALTSEKPNTTNSAELCMAMKSDVGKQYHHAVIIICNGIFFVVLVVTGFSYTCIAKRVIESYRNSGSTNKDGKRKIKARVFIVLAVFLVCFGPYHITRILYVPEQVENKINCNWASLKAAKTMTLWLSTTNVCLDPLIYFLLCKAFRNKLCEFKILGQWFSTTAPANSEETSL
ncbi:P2Y purinoceptor 13-like [Alosa sapidissima]|uniref:P2Y purinoceptor 13-like n=1 Tax=Alosa sapidissima TaxID=34773 RepID=UPI001C0A09A0|nr:P2Y purinoceptor 13-like [Alosa sapidissima]